MAIELSGKIKGGTNELEKLLEMLLLRDQRILGLLEPEIDYDELSTNQISFCIAAKGRKVAHHCVERPIFGIW